MKQSLLLALALAIPAAAAAQGIGLDPTFGTRGVTRTGFAENYVDNAYDMIVQPDGKIVVVGTSAGDGALWVSIARYLPNGRHDATFGTGGEVLFRSDFRDEGRSIALLPDGGYVVAGVRNESNAGSGITPVVYRFTATGAIDTTFGSRGRAVHRFDAISGGVNTTIGVRRNGSILVGGRSAGNINGGTNGFAGWLFKPNGIIDSSIVAAGVSRIALGSLSAVGRGAFDADEKMVLSGLQFIGSGYVLTLARFDQNGAVDFGFGEQGNVTTAVAADISPYPTSVAIDSADRIYAAFTAPDTAGFKKLAVARFGADGFIDESYGTRGVTYVSVGTIADAHGIAMTRDGKALVVGSLSEARGRGIIARLDQSGRLDPSFGIGGVLRTSINADATNSYPLAVATLAGDAFLVAGYESLNDGGDFTIARYDMLTSSAPREDDAADALAVVPNPARDRVTVNVGAVDAHGGMTPATATDVTIADALGRTVARRTIAPGVRTSSIDVGALPAGSYTVRATDGEHVRASRLQIVH